MGLEKAELKIAVVKGLGRRVDEMSDNAKRQVTLQEGAEQAFAVGRENVAKLMGDIDTEFENEEFVTNLVKEPLRVQQYAKDCLKKAVASLHAAYEGARINRIRAEGRVSAMEDLLDFMENSVKAEVAKLERFQEMLRSGDITFEGEGIPGEVAPVIPIEEGREGRTSTRPPRAARPPGVPPGPSIKQQRQAEEAAEKAAAEKAPPKSTPSTSKPTQAKSKPNGEDKKPAKKPAKTKRRKAKAKAKPKSGNGVSKTPPDGGLPPDAPDAG